jgi:hypothetical protein
MCGFPVILASPLENFRMHYTSRTGGPFLRERGHRGVARGRRRDRDAADDAAGRLSLQGWAGRKTRSVGRRPTCDRVSPRFGREDRVLRVRVSPLDHPSLPRQTMHVSLNDRELQS